VGQSGFKLNKWAKIYDQQEWRATTLRVHFAPHLLHASLHLRVRFARSSTGKLARPFCLLACMSRPQTELLFAV